MTMGELRAVFESLGYENVRTVLASGNVLFETARTAETTLSRDIEKALGTTFGARIATTVRTRAQLERLVDADPFADVKASSRKRPFATFLKRKPSSASFPSGRGFEILGIVERTVLSVVDLSGGSTPDFMRVLDRELGSDVTTRGWETVLKVVRAAG